MLDLRFNVDNYLIISKLGRSPSTHWCVGSSIAIPTSLTRVGPEGVFPCVNFRFRVAGMAPTPPIVMTIAGFDPSSGAGITADIKTIAAHECYGVCCITALTVQSTQGVRGVEGVDPKIIRETLEELVSDLAVSAVHIGMLGNAQVVEVVADFLGKAQLPHVVLDPILKSSSGADLLDGAGTRGVIKKGDRVV